MRHDFEMIVHKFDRDIEELNIYPLGDLHIGSEMFSQKTWDVWKNKVLNDPMGRVVIIGDIMDNGLKNSKTNSYEATMRPWEQKEWAKKELKDLKERIDGACTGNHEGRTTQTSDGCPLYDVLDYLGLENVYRYNMAFMKFSLGEKRSDRQYTYTGVLGHGASRGKVEKFGYAVDGMDFIITGHTHKPSVTFPAKIVIDPRNDVVKYQPFIDLVVPSFQSYGGYALRNMYAPTSNTTFPVLKLNGQKKGIKVVWE